MKLNSRTIFPIEARDKLVERWGKVDNGISDMRLALETAEEKCFELKKENEALAQVYLDLNHATTKEIEELNKDKGALEGLINTLEDKIEAYKAVCKIAGVSQLIIDNPTFNQTETLTPIDLKLSKTNH